MAKFYSVIASFYDNGKVVAFLGDTVEAEKIPENTFKSFRDRDCYIDWFETLEEAKAFREEARRA